MTQQLKHGPWPHCVSIDLVPTHGNDSMFDVETWLSKQVGISKQHWYAVYGHNITNFYFKNGTDATMFALKWS
jgi:hypothetical protein